ncbi:MAG: GNAT family N-acetyltransferase [Candidatus Kariarchaeaceae archaeon]|jgi:ribosomal protein S18 acetylase RimI-like enzyme
MIIREYEKYTIRPLQIDDTEEIIEIYETITGENGPDEDDLESRMDYGDSLLCLGAEQNGKLIGFIFGSTRRGEFGETDMIGWVGLLGVHPQFRNLEIGRNLGIELINQFRGLGVKTIRTTVTNNNTSLLKYFMNLGLQPAPWTMLEFQTY